MPGDQPPEGNRPTLDTARSTHHGNACAQTHPGRSVYGGSFAEWDLWLQVFSISSSIAGTAAILTFAWNLDVPPFVGLCGSVVSTLLTAATAWASRLLLGTAQDTARRLAGLLLILSALSTAWSVVALWPQDHGPFWAVPSVALGLAALICAPALRRSRFGLRSQWAVRPRDGLVARPRLRDRVVMAVAALSLLFFGLGVVCATAVASQAYSASVRRAPDGDSPADKGEPASTQAAEAAGGGGSGGGEDEENQAEVPPLPECTHVGATGLPSVDALAKEVLGGSAEPIRGTRRVGSSGAVLEAWQTDADGVQWFLLGTNGAAGIITEGLRARIQDFGVAWPADPDTIMQLVGGSPSGVCRLSPGGELIPIDRGSEAPALLVRPDHGDSTALVAVPPQLTDDWLEATRAARCIAIPDGEAVAGTQSLTWGDTLTDTVDSPVTLEDIQTVALALRLGGTHDYRC